MAHEIDQTTGSAGVAYVGENGTPWHGLGNPVRKGATIEEIEEAAVLGWKVLTRPVQFEYEGQMVVDATHNIMFRSDTRAVLDVTGPGYKPHQNRDVLEFFREYLDLGQMYIDTAGSLRGGKYIWVLGKMDAGFMLPGKDRVEGYVTLMNPHQYGKGMIAKFTSVRIVCMNTYQMALGSGSGGIKIWHTHEFDKSRRDEVKQNLGIARERLEAHAADAIKLVKTTIPLEDAVKVVAEVFKGDPKRPIEQQSRTVLRVLQLFQGAGRGSKLVSADGTAWGVLNAITEYLDHEYGRTVDARLQNSWLGTGDAQKRAATALLLQRPLKSADVAMAG